MTEPAIPADRHGAIKPVDKIPARKANQSTRVGVAVARIAEVGSQEEVVAIIDLLIEVHRELALS